MDMYTHLAMLGIDHVDIRHANILEAPIYPPGWPSRVSPLSGIHYRFRLVDFERARKTNRGADSFNYYHESWVKRLLNNLPAGYVMEMWDF